MSLPLLSLSRFQNLLQLVRPPSCEWTNAIIASEQFSLSDKQIEELQQAIWMMYRYRTNTLTEEDKALMRKQSMKEFEEINSVTTYKWY